MSDERITGSDGVARTFFDWEAFICERHLSCDGDDSVSVLTAEILRITTTTYMLEEETSDDPDMRSKLKSRRLDVESNIEAAAQVMGWYYKEILRQALSKKSLEGYHLEIANQMEKLSRVLSSAGVKRDQRDGFGMCLLEYMRIHKKLPISRKDLKTFGDKYVDCNFKFSRRAIAEQLQWYKLENVCRDNTKG